MALIFDPQSTGRKATLADATAPRARFCAGPFTARRHDCSREKASGTDD